MAENTNRVAKFGICVRNMGRNDLTLLLLSNLNRIISGESTIQPIIFTQEVAPFLGVVPCPIMSWIEVWCFTHPVLAVNFSSARALLDIPGPTKLYYYIHEPPVVDEVEGGYFEISDVLNNEKLTLLCRSELHRDMLKNNYGCDARVIDENYLLDEMLGVEKELIPQ